MQDKLIKRIKKITVLLCDVDGVLTRGGIILGSKGQEFKQFDVQDGMGITLAREGGLKTGIITGRESEAVKLRAKELKMDIIHQGIKDKLQILISIMNDLHIGYENICYIGDDLLDMNIMIRSGISACPGNARKEVKEISDIITEKKGGKGAVRELVEIILKTQNKWNDIIKKYREGK
ncbi:MAG: HAD hydrolase family protein [bacterium]